MKLKLSTAGCYKAVYLQVIAKRMYGYNSLLSLFGYNNIKKEKQTANKEMWKNLKYSTATAARVVDATAAAVADCSLKVLVKC